ncbi:MAG: GNAT family N-acetyltransferase [Bacteroidetes bacterium]|nr:GNAT family N-acetyltransferase [Bacteroidota bacterium]
MTIKKINASDTWPIRQLVMWPDKPIEFVKITGEEKANHYGLYVEDQLVSVISCFESDGEIQFRKFATLIEKQNRGLGTYLLSYIINEAKSRNIKKIWCNARKGKTGYYEKFGMTNTCHEFSKEGIHYVVMEIQFA